MSSLSIETKEEFGLRNIVISINGNIGSGKSRLLSDLKEKYRFNPDFYFVEEPVDEWNGLTDSNGLNLIENYYQDQQKYAFPFQMNAFVTRLRNIQDAIKKDKYKFIVTERCILTDKHIFAKMLFDKGLMNELEYKIYLDLFQHFNEYMYEPIYVYMNTSPDICYQRIKKRNRQGEQNIPLEYLQDCGQYHENWLSDKQIQHKLVINGNGDVSKQENLDEHWLSHFERFVSYYYQVNKKEDLGDNTVQI